MTIINKKCWEPNFKKTNSCAVLPSPEPITIIPPTPVICVGINTNTICADNTTWYPNNQVLGRLGPPPEGYDTILLYTRTKYSDDNVELFSSIYPQTTFNCITFLRVKKPIYLTFNVGKATIALNFLNNSVTGETSQKPYLSAASGLLLGKNLQFTTTTTQKMNEVGNSFFDVGKSKADAYYKVDVGIYTLNVLILSDGKYEGHSIVSSISNEDNAIGSTVINMGLSYSVISCE